MEWRYDMLLVVAAALIDPEAACCSSSVRRASRWPGSWEFPGGKVELGEAPKQRWRANCTRSWGSPSTLRGLRPLAFRQRTPGRAGTCSCCSTRCAHGRGMPVAHHATQLRWVVPAEMRGLAMPPADVPLVEAAGEAGAYQRLPLSASASDAVALPRRAGLGWEASGAQPVR